MTDRELLQLAAKAAGYKWDAWGMDGDGNWWDGTTYLECWNPLTDDGDALRLAMALNFNVCSIRGYGGADDRTNVYSFNHAGYREFSHNGDVMAATRRAVVELAAEIGKAMP